MVAIRCLLAEVFRAVKLAHQGAYWGADATKKSPKQAVAEGYWAGRMAGVKVLSLGHFGVRLEMASSRFATRRSLDLAAAGTDSKPWDVRIRSLARLARPKRSFKMAGASMMERSRWTWPGEAVSLRASWKADGPFQKTELGAFLAVSCLSLVALRSQERSTEVDRPLL